MSCELGMIWIVGIGLEIHISGGPYLQLVFCWLVYSFKTHFEPLCCLMKKRALEFLKRFGNRLLCSKQKGSAHRAIRRSILWSWYKLSALELKSISWGQSANFFTTIIPFRLVNGSPAPVISRSVIICLLLDYIPLAASFTLKKIDAPIECKVYWYLSFLFW